MFIIKQMENVQDVKMVILYKMTIKNVLKMRMNVFQHQIKIVNNVQMIIIDLVILILKISIILFLKNIYLI